MSNRILPAFGLLLMLLARAPLFALQTQSGSPQGGESSVRPCAAVTPDGGCSSQAIQHGENSSDTLRAGASSVEPASPRSRPEENPKPATTPAGPHKLGPLNIAINWRVRAEAWDWFVPPAGFRADAPTSHGVCPDCHGVLRP